MRGCKIGAPQPIRFLDQFRSSRNEALSDNGRTLALLNAKGDMLVADLQGMIAPVTINHHQAEFPLISADGRSLTTYTFNRRGIEVWDATNGNHLHSLPTESPVLAANFSPDNKWLAVDTNRELTFYNMGSWSKSHQLVWDDAEGVSMSHGGMLFTADGELHGGTSRRVRSQIGPTRRRTIARHVADRGALCPLFLQ